MEGDVVVVCSRDGVVFTKFVTTLAGDAESCTFPGKDSCMFLPGDADNLIFLGGESDESRMLL